MTTISEVRSRPAPGLVWHQVRYEQLSFWRNPQSAFFTFVFPVVIILVLAILFHGSDPSEYFGGLTALQYYVCTIAALSVVGSCYSQLAIVLASRRQNGILKRVRATPLPPWAYFVGLLAHCLMVSIVTIVLITGVAGAFGVSAPPASRWGGILLTLVLGATAFCSLGVAVASLIRNSDAAPPIVQFVLFPMLFLSGTYGPINSDVLNAVTGVLPIRPFNQALLAAFTQSNGFSPRDLAVLLAWGVVGAVIAVRRFRWDPRPE
jgi:ABC-2 type transport system permease protein